MTREEKIAKMKAILKSHGISMSVHGCGCCDSPYVTFAYKDETILDEDSNDCEMVCFNTEEDDQ